MHHNEGRFQRLARRGPSLALVGLALSLVIQPGLLECERTTSAPDVPTQQMRLIIAGPTRAIGRPTTVVGGVPALWSQDGRPTRQALEAIRFLAQVDAKGLVPADYEPALLSRSATALELEPWPVDGDVARFDSLMSTEVAQVVHDLHVGRVDPTSLGFNLPSPHDGLDLNDEVIRIANAIDVASEIDRVEPRYAGYVALERTLQWYRILAADSQLRPPHPIRQAVHPGGQYDDMAMLRRLLVAVGDLAADSTTALPSTDSNRYGGPTIAAVAQFQRRNGLAPDSVLGAETMAALRVPLRDRVRQIELALERWRWLPAHPPRRYIVINIPAFRLYTFEDDSIARAPVLAMDAIVGQSRGGHRTPIFAGVMREVVFRPYWDVPMRIARSELVPLLQRHPEDFARDGYEIVRGDRDDAPVVAPSAENLMHVAAGGLRLRQRPGDANALGLVKFVFPNQYDVYLHGTPQQELFARARRDFSHGCIRVEDPVALASFVLRDEPGWDVAHVDSAMHGSETLHVLVQPALEVYVLYATVVTDSAGTSTFYPDLYGHDRALDSALHVPRSGRLLPTQVAATPLPVSPERTQQKNRRIPVASNAT